MGAGSYAAVMCIFYGVTVENQVCMCVSLLYGQCPTGAAAHSSLIRTAPDVSGYIINISHACSQRYTCMRGAVFTCLSAERCTQKINRPKHSRAR